ncbi:MAG: Mur ligase domain-containing protein, partial [Pseudomonadota bacterium]
MMAVQEAARALGAEWRGENAFFTGVSTDSRMVGRGDLFVALRGEKFDGHEFVVTAKERGAVAAMVCQGAETGNQELGIYLILVKDTLLGLG